jgi:hypothetical protein
MAILFVKKLGSSAARGGVPGMKSKAGRKEMQIGGRKSKARRKEIKGRRNEIQTPIPSENLGLSMGYPFVRARGRMMRAK